MASVSRSAVMQAGKGILRSWPVVGGLAREWSARAASRRLQRDHPGATFAGTGRADAECSLERGVIVQDGTALSRTRVGCHTYFAPGSAIHLAEIGRYCSFGPRVIVGPGRHPARQFVSTHPYFYALSRGPHSSYVNEQCFTEWLPTRIGHDVWVGAGSIIMDGVSVGDGAIVGAGAVVTHDVAPYTVVGGVPTRVIRERFSSSDILWLQRLQWWHRDESWLRRHASEFRDVALLRAALTRDSDLDSPLVSP